MCLWEGLQKKCLSGICKPTPPISLSQPHKTITPINPSPKFISLYLLTDLRGETWRTPNCFSSPRDRKRFILLHRSPAGQSVDLQPQSRSPASPAPPAAPPSHQLRSAPSSDSISPPRNTASRASRSQSRNQSHRATKSRSSAVSASSFLREPPSSAALSQSPYPPQIAAATSDYAADARRPTDHLRFQKNYSNSKFCFRAQPRFIPSSKPRLVEIQ